LLFLITSYAEAYLLVERGGGIVVLKLTIRVKAFLEQGNWIVK